MKRVGHGTGRAAFAWKTFMSAASTGTGTAAFAKRPGTRSEETRALLHCRLAERRLRPSFLGRGLGLGPERGCGLLCAEGGCEAGTGPGGAGRGRVSEGERHGRRGVQQEIRPVDRQGKEGHRSPQVYRRRTNRDLKKRIRIETRCWAIRAVAERLAPSLKRSIGLKLQQTSEVRQTRRSRSFF